MELTMFELQMLADLDKQTWGDLENNKVVRIHTNRAFDAIVRKVPRHPGHYLVTAA